jgi:NAD(P)H dehydrogenase (quinone)
MTMKPVIVIGGASGATGRVATKHLLDQGFPVRALVRKEDERSAKLKEQGAEIVVGDLTDLPSLRRAFEGAKRGYFVFSIRPGIVQATATFAQAAREAGFDAIVNMSQRTSRADAESQSAIQHWLAEQVFDWSGTPVTHLRPTIFHDWLLYMRGQVRDGRYHVPFAPEGKFSPIASEDQGAVIAAILANPAAHAGKTYELYGPEELTAPDIARIAGDVLGHEVRYEQISGEQWVRNLYGDDVPFLSQHLDAIARAQATGGMQGLNDIVERLSGRRPMSAAAFVEKYRAAFQ